jgi:hypothetical protein
MWTLSKESKAIVESKGAALGKGETGWVKPNMRLFSKTYKLKGVDWLNLSRGAGIHIFDGHIGVGLTPGEQENQIEAWESILTLFHMCCVITCNVDGRPPTPEQTERSTTHNTPQIDAFHNIL